jgi:hydroxymethylpyrimidine/phosphomethylpyrimidine kinase
VERGTPHLSFHLDIKPDTAYLRGLEADQKVIAAHRCYALTATTALTAQNTLGVQDIHITPPEFVGKQINACLEDVGADVVKMGE